MKKIKQFLLSFVLILALAVPAVYADEAADYYSALNQTASDEDTAIQYAQSYMSQFASMDLDDAAYFRDNSNGFLQEAAENYYTYLENDTLGEFQSIKSTKVKEIEAEKGYTVVCTAEFENVNLVMTMDCTYVINQMTPTAIKFSTIENHPKSLGEKMGDAALNTVIGLVTVFAILILISFIISLFRYIPVIQEKFAKKQETIQEKETQKIMTAQPEIKEELSDDTELVAVITAAICAATGSSSDGFVVRSIRRSKRKFD